MMNKNKTIISEVVCCDNMEFMEKFPDNFFDLGIVDPPYGINKKITGGLFKKYGNKQLTWDNNIPDDRYFKELFRVSRNQIIFGANYFPYLWHDGCRGFLFWDKLCPVENFSAGELAFTSFDTPAKIARIPYSGFIGKDRIRFHPTQKPITLYNWIIKNYAKPGNKILDTHLGSQSSRIAAYRLGFDFWGCEMDPGYYQDGCKRFEQECHEIIDIGNGLRIQQQSLFNY